MPAPPRRASPRIELVAASLEQEPTLANLLELYAYDFSECLPLELGVDGRFGYKDLPLYWSDSGRFPFLIEVDGRLGGLALVKKGSESSERINTWDVAEFFVVRAHRRRRTGTEAAHAMWRRFPGPWQVRVMHSNQAALKFWNHAIATYQSQSACAERIEIEGVGWYVFAFECGDEASGLEAGS